MEQGYWMNIDKSWPTTQGRTDPVNENAREILGHGVSSDDSARKEEIWMPAIYFGQQCL